MPQYTYKARKTSGQITTGTIEAADRRQALQRIQQNGTQALAVNEAESARTGRAAKWMKGLQTLGGSHQAAPRKEATSQPPRGGSPRRETAGLGLLKRLLELHSSGMPVGDSIRTLSQRLS